MGISQELQEVMAAIKRLNPEWQADYPGHRPHVGQMSSIAFSKDAEGGTYKGSIYLAYRYNVDSELEYQCVGIEVTVSNGAGKITLFSKSYVNGEEAQSLICYIKSNQAYREEISRRELETIRQREDEQKKREAKKEAEERFLGRKTKKAPVLVTALPAVLPINAKASSEFTVDDATDLCTSDKANYNLKLLLARRQGKGKPLTDVEFVRKVRLLASI